jgi:diguanylate cyclase (GGDEF)-like protein
MNRLNRKDRPVIVVGDAVDSQSLPGLTDAPVEPVPSLLHALGRLGGGAVGGLIIGAPDLGDSPESSVAALRQLGPNIPVILTTTPDYEPLAQRAVRLGLDDYFVRPVDIQCIGQRLDALAGPNGPSVDQADSGEPTADQASSEQGSAPRPSPTIAQAPSVLLDHLLTRRHQFTEALMALLREHAGHEDIQLIDTPQQGADNSVPIRYASLELGYLQSESIDRKELEPLAEWACRWLALHNRVDELNRLAWHDELTGAWNRRYFDRFLGSVLRRARARRFRVSLMLFDIDEFKTYNDRFGHAAGDEILKEAARLMNTLVRKHDVVARIGGDEFAVIFWDADKPRQANSEHPTAIGEIARRFQKAICQHRFPKLAEGGRDTLTISGGLASFPWDGQTPEQLLDLADRMLLKSKASGKNALTFGPGALADCSTGDSDNT